MCIVTLLNVMIGIKCQHRSWKGSCSEQIWIGLYWWPPDVTSSGRFLSSDVPCPNERTCKVTSNASWVMVTYDSPFPLCTEWRTDTTENNTVPQLRCRAEMMDFRTNAVWRHMLCLQTVKRRLSYNYRAILFTLLIMEIGFFNQLSLCNRHSNFWHLSFQYVTMIAPHATFSNYTDKNCLLLKTHHQINT